MSYSYILWCVLVWWLFVVKCLSPSLLILLCVGTVMVVFVCHCISLLCLRTTMAIRWSTTMSNCPVLIWLRNHCMIGLQIIFSESFGKNKVLWTLFFYLTKLESGRLRWGIKSVTPTTFRTIWVLSAIVSRCGQNRNSSRSSQVWASLVAIT